MIDDQVDQEQLAADERRALWIVGGLYALVIVAFLVWRFTR